MNSILRCVATVVAVLLLVGIHAGSSAQFVPTLTSEQQRLLDTIPPAQRKALFERYVGARNSVPGRAPVSQAPSLAGFENSEASPPVAAPTDQIAANDLLVLVVGDEDIDTDTLRNHKIQIEEGNPYRVDELGQLQLPRIKSMELAGLSEEQAKVRLEAEPQLKGLVFTVFRMPVTAQDDTDVEPFGYSFFERKSNESPISSAAQVPVGYKVGPGDHVEIQMYGGVNATYSLEVNRDGSLFVPELDPLQVLGLTLENLRDELEAQVSRKMLGTKISVSLGELRSIRVFLVGDVERPGAYTTSAYSTITNMLVDGGGVSLKGSLRKIQLKRNGITFSRLDLYGLLLRGDASADKAVQDGDVIFVPPIGKQVEISGEVARPAIYELWSGSAEIGELLMQAGGTTPNALLNSIRVERVQPASGLDVLEVDLSTLSGAQFSVVGGDRITVLGEAFGQMNNVVRLSGEVLRPGNRSWTPNLRLTDILRSRRDLRDGADARYVLIKRINEETGKIEIKSVDLQSQWHDPITNSPPILSARDEIIVFGIAGGREAFLIPILEDLVRYSDPDEPTLIVRVSGEVKAPGSYPLEEGMTVGDLIRAAGGLTESAHRASAELRRYHNDGLGVRDSELIEVSLDNIKGYGSSGGLMLQAFDSLIVKEIAEWGFESYIDVKGEVVYPGRYSVASGETLSSVIGRAGGVKDTAFLQGSVFTRKVLRDREREQLDKLSKRIESDLASLAFSDRNQASSISAGRSLVDQLRNAQVTGRLVINMQDVLDNLPHGDPSIRDGDALFVPKISQEVTVIGEVQHSTSHLWNARFGRDQYISRSGGFTSKADTKRVYVVRANGEIVVGSRSLFFAQTANLSIQAGDTVVVPLNTERVAPLILWGSATQILYNLAIAVAAVNGL